MTNLEELYIKRVNAKNDAVQTEIDKQIKIRDEKLRVCKRFFEQISFLNNHGFKWEIYASCNNGHDCCMAYYGWSVLILNRTIATSPFESIICKEFDGEVKGKWEPTILGHGRYVEGQDKDGWFTAEQLVMALS